jgi:hypothetical protein
MKDILNVIPAQKGVRAIKQDEGKPFDLGPVHFRWKVRRTAPTPTPCSN